MEVNDWLGITKKISREFELEGCFLLNKTSKNWVGDSPPMAFQNYLYGLFDSKESSYFNEIRFYKFKGDANDSKVLNYLALIPVSMERISFNFLGLIYQNAEHLQDLLKFRIMPMYLLFWLHQALIEHRAHHGGDDDGQEENVLIKALAEKKLYAGQLEAKVKALSEDINRIKASGLSQDQKIVQLEKMLEEQNQEYKQLVGSYQELYDMSQALEREYLTSAVAFEKKIYEQSCDLTRVRYELEQLQKQKSEQSGEPAAGNQAPAPVAARTAPTAEVREVQMLKAKLNNAQKLAMTYQERNKALSKKFEKFGDITPEQFTQIVESMGQLQARVEQYKQRCNKLELSLRTYQAKYG